MGAEALSSRGILGMLFAALARHQGGGIVEQLAMRIDSNQTEETHKWLGQVPAMREWIGGRQAKGLRENGITIENKMFESTLEVFKRELKLDKTGQLQVRINELARAAAVHPYKLITDLIINAVSQVCYDGQYFFDVDHAEGDSGTQSNKITYNVATPTAPTAKEMVDAILASVVQMIGFKDDQGEPMNEAATEFLVITPPGLLAPALSAVTSPALAQGETNVLMNSDFKIRVVANARLSWTDQFAMFRTDGDAKPFIHQVEQDIEASGIAEGSELEFKEGKHQYGVSMIDNVGYGFWQKACHTTLN